MRSPRKIARERVVTALASALAWVGMAGLGPGARPARGFQEGPRVTLEGAQGWINTDGPVHLEKLRGKVVLLDFWAYCCINCHHVLPELARLEAKYRNQLVVLGVHSAKFDAEKDLENIRAKVREYGIKHPVANDADRVIWDRFKVRSWPTFVLIDAGGQVAGTVSGEAGAAQLDAEVGRLVARARSRGELDETPVEFPAEVDKPHPGGLLYPGKITADAAAGRLYISDTGHNRIVVTELDGKLVETIGGGKEGLVDGDFAAATFNRPQGTCLLDGVLYVADTENHALRAVDLKAKAVRTVAGTGKQSPLYSVSGKGTVTALNSPWDVVPIPGTKILAIAMAGPHQIWRYDVARGIVSSWAGSGYENILDGTLAQARFAQPSGLATDGQHLFVADSEVSGLRSITLGASHRVATIVGVGLFGFGDVDGQGTGVRLQHCLGIAYGDGKLYVADTYNNKVKVCDPKTRAVKTLAGDGKRGSGDAPAEFNEPGGLALVGSSLYVADTNNHLIRVVDVNTKAVRTLGLEGVKAPARSKAPRFPNATVVDVPAARAMPGREVDLAVALDLPAGYKVSEEAPMIYLIEADQPDAFAGGLAPNGRRVEPPAREFSIRLPLARQVPSGSKMKLKVSVSAFVCLPNSLCTVKNFVWNVPITFEVGNPGPIRLSTSAP